MPWPPRQRPVQLKSKFTTEVLRGMSEKAKAAEFPDMAISHAILKYSWRLNKPEQGGSVAVSSPQCWSLPWRGVGLGEDAGRAWGTQTAF